MTGLLFIIAVGSTIRTVLGRARLRMSQINNECEALIKFFPIALAKEMCAFGGQEYLKELLYFSVMACKDRFACVSNASYVLYVLEQEHVKSIPQTLV